MVPVSNGALAKQLPAILSPENWTHLWRTGKSGIRCHVALHQSLATQLLANHSYSVELPVPLDTGTMPWNAQHPSNPETKPAPSRKPRVHSDPQNAAALEVDGFATLAVFFRGDTHKSTHRFSRRAIFCSVPLRTRAASYDVSITSPPALRLGEGREASSLQGSCGSRRPSSRG